MKTKIIYIYVLLFLSAATFLALDYSPSQEPSGGPHGGIVKSAEDFYIEFKNNPDTSFYAYLLDKKQKTISNKGISGEVKFFFPDSTALDVQLKPAAGDGFTTKSITGYSSCKITFEVYGKSVSALFEKQNQVVQKK